MLTCAQCDVLEGTEFNIDFSTHDGKSPPTYGDPDQIIIRRRLKTDSTSVSVLVSAAPTFTGLEHNGAGEFSFRSAALDAGTYIFTFLITGSYGRSDALEIRVRSVVGL